LNDSRSVAQIEEDDAAEVAGPVDPAAQFHFRADVRLSELAAQMRALCRGKAG
jgi:hypothetical protein